MPLSERRKLCARVSLAHSSLPTPTATPPPRIQPSVVTLFEQILSDVGVTMGLGRRASIGEVKKKLREHAPQDDGGLGVYLASKVGKLSKFRNTTVHDSALRQEVRDYLESHGGVFREVRPDQQSDDDDNNDEESGVETNSLATLDGDQALAEEARAKNVLASMQVSMHHSSSWWAGPITTIPQHFHIGDDDSVVDVAEQQVEQAENSLGSTSQNSSSSDIDEGIVDREVSPAQNQHLDEQAFVDDTADNSLGNTGQDTISSDLDEYIADEEVSQDNDQHSDEQDFVEDTAGTEKHAQDEFGWDASEQVVRISGKGVKNKAEQAENQSAHSSNDKYRRAEGKGRGAKSSIHEDRGTRNSTHEKALDDIDAMNHILIQEETAGTAEMEAVTDSMQKQDMERWLSSGFSPEQSFFGAFGRAPTMRSKKGNSNKTL